MLLRTRLTAALVAAHLVLTGLAGWAAWTAIDGMLRHQAEDSARAVGRVLARGGFSADERVLAHMRELSGRDFRLVEAGAAPVDGAVVVVEGGVAVEVMWRTPQLATARWLVLVATAAVALVGTLAFSVVAWLIARRFAGPIEELSRCARAIGADLSLAIPRLGSGEVAGLATELEAMRARLVEAMASARQAERLATLGVFSATVAHEVRNPLTAVRLSVQMLRRQHPAEPDLPRVLDELDRLDLIVDEILSFARGMRCELVACPLREVAEDAVRLLRRQADHAGIALVVEGPEVEVSADPRRLRQLLINLILNAIQACAGGRGGRVVVRLLPDGLAVEDDGPGVPPALVARLFAPFSSDRPEGTGLGLHLARAVAEAHGAELAYRALAPGACFTVRLSRVAAAEAQASLASPAPKPRT